MSCLYPKWDKKSQAKISPDILSPLLHFKYRQKSKVSTKIGVETGQYLLDRLRQIYTEAMETWELRMFCANVTESHPGLSRWATPKNPCWGLSGTGGCSLLSHALAPYSGCCCSVAHSCLTLCDPTNSSMPGFPVLHYLPEFAQTHVHWVYSATTD